MSPAQPPPRPLTPCPGCSRGSVEGEIHPPTTLLSPHPDLGGGCEFSLGTFPFLGVRQEVGPVAAPRGFLLPPPALSPPGHRGGGVQAEVQRCRPSLSGAPTWLAPVLPWDPSPATGCSQVSSGTSGKCPRDSQPAQLRKWKRSCSRSSSASPHRPQAAAGPFDSGLLGRICVGS